MAPDGPDRSTEPEPTEPTKATEATKPEATHDSVSEGTAALEGAAVSEGTAASKGAAISEGTAGLPSSEALGPRRDKVTGMSILLVTFLATLCLAWWAKWKNTPTPPEPPGPPDTTQVQGFPQAIDAVATLPAARERTPREVLRGIVLRGVTSEGVIDINAPSSEVRYVFQSRAGEGPQPPRDPEGRAPRPYCGKQVVRITAQGLQEDEDETKTSCGVKGFEPLPEPRCGPKEVWAHAIAKDIPTDKPAELEYYRAQAGPAWRFRVPGTRHRFSLYGDCERELKGMEEVGSVP